MLHRADTPVWTGLKSADISKKTHIDVFLGGASSISTKDGPIRNPGRDRLWQWLSDAGLTYFDPQIHLTTHKRDYDQKIDGPKEKLARRIAKLRVYEIIPETMAPITFFELLDDVRKRRRSIAWIHGPFRYIPTGTGSIDDLKQNTALQKSVDPAIYYQLMEGVKGGNRMRDELPQMIGRSKHSTFVEADDTLVFSKIMQMLAVEKT
jgi:hypothetical protein